MYCQRQSSKNFKKNVSLHNEYTLGDFMKLIFKTSYEELKERLSVMDGVWDESQKNKKVLRLNGGVMNWYESTGTIYFQGGEEGRRYLESRVKLVLYSDEFPIIK